jgi:hypothetical protein
MTSPEIQDFFPWVQVAAVVGIAITCMGLVAGLVLSRRGRGNAIVPTQAGDRRGVVRRDGEPVEVVLAVGPDGSVTLRGLVVDRSVDGLGMHLPREVAPGEALTVRAAAAPEGAPWTAVRVRHCRPMDGDCWAVGCEFLAAPPQNTGPLFG